MDVKLKVQSLLVQWVRHFVMAQSSWSGFLGFWFHSVFNSSPVEVSLTPLPSVLAPCLRSISHCYWLGMRSIVPFHGLVPLW